MNPQTHFLFTLLLSSFFVRLGLLSWKLAFLAALLTILFDLDHYLEHIFKAKKNKFSLKDTWNNSIALHRYKQRSFLHHSLGIVFISIILFLISLINLQTTLILALAYYPHVLLDHLYLSKEHLFKNKIGPVYFRESLSEIVLDILLILLFLFI